MMKDKQMGSAKMIKLAVIVAICGVIAVGIALLPRGFKDDLSVVGQGLGSVVLTHNKELAGSLTMMELLNKVRTDYEETINFLAVDVHTPIGRNFMQQQNVGSVALVMFDPAGARHAVFTNGISERELRTTLDKILSL